MPLTVHEVSPENILSEVAARLPMGYRFVTMTCTDLGTAHDLLYHFDRDFHLETLRMTLPRGQKPPSISVIYSAALLVENEIQDLFGIRFSGLVLDYQGRLLLSEGAPAAPQNKTISAAPAAPKAPAGEGEGTA
jgi:ech hydrogenase subunit D